MNTIPIATAFFMLFAFMTSNTVGQETYHDKNGKVVSDSNTASFSRKIFKKEGYEYPYFEEYYYPDGKKRRTGFIKDLEFSQQSFIDTLTIYHENGYVECKIIYPQNSNDITLLNYYSNGQLHTKRLLLTSGNFQKPFYKILTFYDSLGNIYIKDGKGFIRENKDNGDFEEGHYENGVRTGLWKGTFEKGKHNFEESYKEGEITEGKATSIEDGNVYIYTQLFEPPHYDGGIPRFSSFIAANYRVPGRALNAGVSGTLVINFIVNKNGTLTDFKILKDLGYGTADAGIRTIKKTERKWIPGKNRGVPTNTSFTAPINL